MRFSLFATGAWTLVLLFGMGTTVWQLAGDGQGPKPAGSDHSANGAKGGPQRMFGWEPTEATRVILSSSSQVREFRRSGASPWEEVGDIREPFDVDGYIGLFSQARIDRVLISEAGNDQQLGLDIPALRIVVEAPDGKVLADVECGAGTPDGFGRYVRLSGRPGVAIVPGYQVANAIKAVNSSTK